MIGGDTILSAALTEAGTDPLHPTTTAKPDGDGFVLVCAPENEAAIYAEARRLLLKGMREQDSAPVAEAETLITEIAQSWSAIGNGIAVSS